MRLRLREGVKSLLPEEAFGERCVSILYSGGREGLNQTDRSREERRLLPRFGRFQHGSRYGAVGWQRSC